MTVLAAFCVATALFLAYRDLFVPEVADVEVWFGVEVHGAAARWSAPIHWSIFAVGAWGFWRGFRATLAWASAYAFYIALGHLVWNGSSPHGGGWPMGLLQGALLSLPGFGLLWAYEASRERSGSTSITKPR